MESERSGDNGVHTVIPNLSVEELESPKKVFPISR